MLDLLTKYITADADFVEIRASKNKITSVLVKKGEVDAAVSGEHLVFSARVLLNGAFGFSSTNNQEKIQDMVGTALKMAKISQKKSMGIALSAEEVHCDKVRVRVRKKPADVPLDQKIHDVLEANKMMRMPTVISYNTAYSESGSDYFYLNSEGARIAFHNITSMLSFSSFAKNSTLQGIAESFGGQLGYEIFDKYFSEGEKISKKAVDLLAAEVIKSGVYDVVLDQKMGGTLAHEAVGHACEADSVLTGESILRGKLEKRIGSKEVNIIDDPTIPGAFGSYPYDDEGVKSRRTVLVENGILRAYLHSRETAHKMKTHSTSNARAQSVGAFPIVRMSNTFFEPGDYSFEELIDLRRGVFVSGCKGGGVEISTGEFQFAADQGWLIENGKLTKPLRDISIFGNILTTLKNADAFDRNFEGYHPGICGKGLQQACVSDASPNVRIRKARLGGA